ncbi:MAG TPA: hypothetical protein VHF90_02080 [Thermoleophilaceae bacterium]|nr:hypothetical protein [Thermoleophilaceae bacterium]
MGLAANPDFQKWLDRYVARHETLHGDGPAPPAGVCDGCGDPLPDPPSSTPFCIVCLAEQYGRDRAQSAARVATALRLALADDLDTPVSDIREAVEEVLEDLALTR